MELNHLLEFQFNYSDKLLNRERVEGSKSAIGFTDTRSNGYFDKIFNEATEAKATTPSGFSAGLTASKFLNKGKDTLSFISGESSRQSTHPITREGASIKKSDGGEVPLESGTGKIFLGTITEEIPTVSELIYASDYKKECWNILSKDVNGSKPFKRIQPGTDIYLDSKTSEIIWGEKVSSSSTGSLTTIAIDGETAGSSDERSHENLTTLPLNHAVSKFIGRGYDQMDCYEMVVEGLKDIGVSYQGSNGLGKYLVDKAVGSGLPYNHYLNGEGLVEAAGQSVYHKRIYSVNNPKTQAKDVLDEMAPVLKEGQILSFSTRSRGHTGVVSKNNDIWTFINSGNMDNSVAGKNGAKQVGEEILSKELENWFRLAGNRKEGLQITLGNIDMTKLAAYRNKTAVGQAIAMSG